MSTKSTPRIPGAVRFSRAMRLRWIVAMGATISVGLGVFILLGPFVQLAGRQHVTTPYLLLIVIAIPLVLTFTERLAVIPGSGGIYNLGRTSGKVSITFATGWLLLGGYVVLIALLSWGVALHLNLLTENLLKISLDLPQLTIVVIGLVALYNILGTNQVWKARSIYIYACIIFLAFIIFRDLLKPTTETGTTSFIYGTNSILELTALMFSGLWGLQFILNVRDEVHRPSRTLLRAMFFTVALGSGLGALAGLSLNNADVAFNTWTPLIEITSDFGLIPKSLLVILYASFGLLISFIALNQGFINLLLLGGDMTRDGFLPKRFQVISKKHNAPTVSLVIFALISIFLILQMSVLVIAGLTALSLLWSIALAFLPEAFQTKPNLPKKRYPKLPFHPLFPWLVIATGVFLPINLSFEIWLYGAIWATLGALYYVFYGHQRGVSVRRQEVVVGDTRPIRSQPESKHVVLVGIANPKTAPELLRTGAKLARAKNGTVLALKVLQLAEQIPAHLKRQAAEKEWEYLAELVQEIDTEGVTVYPLVRLAPNPTAGILAAVGEEGAHLLLLGWEGQSSLETGATNSVLNPILKRATCNVAILRGSLPRLVKQILVPSAGGPHARMAATLGHGLAEPNEGQILIEHIVTEPLSPERQAQAQAELKSTLAAIKHGTETKQHIIEADTVKEGILNAARRSDLLLIGASNEGFLETSFFGGLPTEVATDTVTPILMIKNGEGDDHYKFRRFWEFLFDPLPTLTIGRQVEVYQGMRQAAQPSVDFFVLIGLAATIASLGLLQNSAAVIIGAMLVAPLMSPILAMAMSMVHGDLRLLVVAAEATTKGVVLAIIVGITMVIISPIDTATTEILARTQPNILDLLVALASGAAAGYALSRKEVAAALPGVAIAAALVPPLCVVGYGLGTSQLNLAGGALLLFITNLIAIVFAAAITFLALGFHPTRSERGELMRGLQVTVVSLGIIAIILGFTTIFTMIETNRQNSVEQIFNHEIVARAAEVREMTIERHGNGFIIQATIIDIVESQLTPAELTRIEEELTKAVGAPVDVQATILFGTRQDVTGADDRRRLENIFKGKMVELGAQVEFIKIEEDKGRFAVTATVLVFEQGQISQTDMTAIQENLSEIMETPVSIQTTVLFAQRVNAVAPVPPTPTPEP